MTFIYFTYYEVYILLIFLPMKYLFSLIFLISIVSSTPLAYADFFEEQIVGTDPETAMIQEIGLNSVNLRDANEMRRYNNTLYFITNIKNETIYRLSNRTIPLYRRYDIITSLDSFVYTMNQYFLYQKRYEQTGGNAYKETARYYLEDAK